MPPFLALDMDGGSQEWAEGLQQDWGSGRGGQVWNLRFLRGQPGHAEAGRVASGAHHCCSLPGPCLVLTEPASVAHTALVLWSRQLGAGTCLKSGGISLVPSWGLPEGNISTDNGNPG